MLLGTKKTKTKTKIDSVRTKLTRAAQNRKLALPGSLAVSLSAGRVVRPGVDQVIQVVAGAVRASHVTMPLEGVGRTDVTQVKAALDELLDLAESGGVGESVVEVADHADG